MRSESPLIPFGSRFVLAAVAESRAVAFARRKPAVIEDEELDTAINFRRFRNLHEFIFVKVKIRGFPVIDENRTFLITPISACHALTQQAVHRLTQRIKTRAGWHAEQCFPVSGTIRPDAGTSQNYADGYPS